MDTEKITITFLTLTWRNTTQKEARTRIRYGSKPFYPVACKNDISTYLPLIKV